MKCCPPAPLSCASTGAAGVPGAVVSSVNVRLDAALMLSAASRSSIDIVWLPSAVPSVARVGTVVVKLPLSSRYSSTSPAAAVG